MIELNKKTRQDFLDREWVQRLLDAGVDMSDAKYYIVNNICDGKDFVVYGRPQLGITQVYDRIIPTYTTAELMYKLHEYIYPVIDGKEYFGGLRFVKDAPFYMFYYALKTRDYEPQLKQGDYNENYIFAENEFPIESLASVLLQCHKKDTGITDMDGNKVSDVGDISDK